jgi:hypothetical protein
MSADLYRVSVMRSPTPLPYHGSMLVLFHKLANHWHAEEAEEVVVDAAEVAEVECPTEVAEVECHTSEVARRMGMRPTLELRLA